MRLLELDKQQPRRFEKRCCERRDVFAKTRAFEP